MIALAWALGACTVDEYESGDSRYSYMRAEFGMIHTSEAGKTDYLLTDDGDSVAFDGLGMVGWAAGADSMYRALVYYDVSTSRFFSAKQVLVVTPAKPAPGKSVSTDPLTIESVWVGGRFLNIGFAVKAGNGDSIASSQQLGLMLEGNTMSQDGRRILNIRLVHDQNNMPEYYTVRGYMSMPLASDMKGASIRLRANTYKGEKTFNSFIP
ncbi:hypothetical protein HMPREF1870_00590 [Bacteroidales bacterium KA00344]|nr:hypothetical protein HMPREF1870_00590 [Bacteroidales bacterium KA00344]